MSISRKADSSEREAVSRAAGAASVASMPVITLVWPDGFAR